MRVLTFLSVLLTVSPFTHAQNDGLTRSCLIEICGPAEKIRSAESLIRNALSDPEALTNGHREVLTRWVAALNGALDATDREEKELTDEFVKLIEADRLEATPGTQIVHNLGALMSALKRLSYEEGPDIQTPFVVDTERSRSALDEFTPAERDWILAESSRFLNSPVGRESVLGQLLTPDRFFEIKYPGLTPAEGVRRLGGELAARIERIKTDSAAEAIRNLTNVRDCLEDETVGLAVSGRELSVAQMRRLLEVATFVNVVADMTSGHEVLSAAPYPVSVRTILNRLNAAAKLKAYKDAERNPEQLSQIRQQVFGDCMKAFVFGLALSPDQRGLAQARENERWAKERVQRTLRQAFPGETGERLARVIASSYFALPQDASTFTDSFISRIESKTREQESLRAYIRENSGKPYFPAAMLVDFHYAADEDLIVENRFRDVKEICDDYQPKGMSDATYTSAGNIQTSWYTVAEPSAGRGIMMHELGHIAFHGLNADDLPAEDKARLAAIKACLARKHPEAPDRRYIEEDWADLVAAKGMSERRNPFCGFVDLMNDDEKPKLRSDETSRKHSEHLFRILHVQQIERGELPTVCRAAVQSVDPGLKFDACF